MSIFLQLFFIDFNPRTREGCDSSVLRARRTVSDFNPRTREGCDDPKDREAVHQAMISIHAPVKGATFTDVRDIVPQVYFNPRTREGCDKG